MSTTTNNLTIGQRIIADEGPFFKVVQIICAIALIAGGFLAYLNFGPVSLRGALLIAGTTGYAFTLLIADGINKIINDGFTPSNVFSALLDLTNGVKTIMSQLAAPPPALDLNSIVKLMASQPAAATPDVAGLPVSKPTLSIVPGEQQQ